MSGTKKKPITQALVFAAGFGKRLKPLTDHTPKPLIPIGDTTCLDFAIQRITEAGIQTIVVNTHHLANQIHLHLEKYLDGPSILDSTLSFSNSTLSSSDLIRGSMGSRVKPENDKKTLEKYPKIIISHEPEILETGGGFINAMPHFNPKEPILIVNGDIWWQDASIPVLKRLQDAWDPDKMDCLLLLVPKEVSIGYYGKGDYFLNDARRAEYRGQKDRAPYVYPGICVINPVMLHPNRTLASAEMRPKVFSIKSLFDQAENNHRLSGLVHQNLWGDIGSPQGLEDVRKMCSALQHKV